FVAVAWFTNTRMAIRMIFNLDTTGNGHPVLLMLRDATLALFFGVLMVVSAGLTVVSSSALSAIFDMLGIGQDTWFTGLLGRALSLAVMLAFDVAVLFLIFKVLAGIRGYTKDILFGCLLGASATLAIKILGTSLLGGATKNPLLASFAVVVGLLIWFNLLCRVLLFSASWIVTGINRTLGMPPSKHDEPVLEVEEERTQPLTDIEREKESVAEKIARVLSRKQKR
ncbi:MAG: YhjD/YihY/BrkB family envelope integrity protein, partial [Microbacteriaceae bacterium]|nr:YhjD/YihY/BrkB family envelope integrity protein [Microbacteriaceae bacterium]